MVHILFWALFVGGGVSAYFNGAGLWVAVGGTAAPLIAWFGGSGTRGSLYGVTPQKIAGVVVGLLCLGLSAWWVEAVGFRIRINLSSGITILGWQWVLAAFVIGFVFTSRKFAPGGSEDVIGRRQNSRK